jgi:CubicO group peptidase (beta-lactamase class C family)
MALAFIVAAILADPDPLRTTIETHSKLFGVPGIAVVIVHNEKTILGDGFGTRDGQLPFDADTLVPIGSCTKAFTSAVAASLVAENAMTWDDPVRKHLPDFRLASGLADRNVTIRDLLSHRTGLNGHDLLWYKSSRSLAESVAAIRHLPRHGPFRESFHYCSLTVAAVGLGLAAERKTTWEAMVRDRILTKAGIRDAAFTTAQAKTYANRAAIGFRVPAKGDPVAVPAYDFREANPAGSLHLSARGLEKWLRFQLDPANDWLSETKSPQIDVPMSETVKAYHPTSPKVSYGMGWLIAEECGTPVVLHGGAIDGFRCQVTLYPKEKLGIAIVNNSHESSANIALTSALADVVLKRKPTDWTGALQAFERRQLADADERWARLNQFRRRTPPDVPVEQFAGVYENPAYGRGTIECKDDKLTWVWSSFRVPLAHWGGNAFLMSGEPFERRFLEFTGANGVVRELKFAEQLFGKVAK